MSNNMLQVSAVHLSFGQLKVLNDIWLNIAPGEVVAIVGPSGCGKSSLLNIILGFYKPSFGTIRRSGTMRMVYQRDGLFPWLTAAENIAVGVSDAVGQKDRVGQVQELLKLTRLEGFSDYFPHQLSGGMRRRIELARVLASNADLILMDEPFSALDYQTRMRMIQEFVRVLGQRPRAVILVTHDVEEAVLLADRILVLSERPASINFELAMDLERPRKPGHPIVADAVAAVLSQLEAQENCNLIQRNPPVMN